jgi:site-specific DNA-methyltransferase (adenine-specific)
MDKLRVKKNRHLHFDKNEWRTPPDLFTKLDDEFSFTVDAAATAENALCDRYWTKADNGLYQSWAGESVYFNPPYGRDLLTAWTEKAFWETWQPQDFCEVAVGLLPADRTEQAWLHDYVLPRAEIRWIRGRIKFLMPDGGHYSTPTFGSMICIWRGHHG